MRSRHSFSNISVVMGLAVMALLFSTFITKPSAVWAQDGIKQTPVPGTTAPQVFDSYPHPNTRGALRYVIADKWNKTSLTYQFDNCPTLVSCPDAENVVRQAFADWSAVSVLTFTNVSSGADIEISWAGAEQDMGPGSDTLGFAYFPSDGGDLFINDSIQWQFYTGSDDDMYLTVAHEIGHALGLDHSGDPASLMYPTATEQTTGIASDDIAAIQALYGAPDGSAPTLNVDNTPTTVQPDNSGGTSSANAGDGQLTDSTPYELWEIDVEAGDTYAFTVTRVDGDLIPHVGVLTDDENTVLAESDNSGGDQASVTVTFSDAGTYVVMVTRDGVEDGTTQGSYLLDIELGASDNSQSTDNSTDNSGGNVDNYAGAYVDVYNFTGTDLCELYIVSSDSPEWNDEWLGGEPLADGESISSDLDAGSYDVLAVTCDGAEIESYGFNISGSMSIEIYGDAVSVYQ